MNAAHIIGRKKNRLKRCHKRLTTGELGSQQRSALQQRQSELGRELIDK
jgi:hypothetical protein